MKDLALDLEVIESIEAPSGWSWQAFAIGVAAGATIVALT